MDLPGSLSIDEVFLGSLSSHIGEEWEIFGTHIGLSRDQVERLKQDYNNTKDRVFNMLVIWRQMQPRDVNLRETLVEALKSCGRDDLAHNLHKIRSLSTHNLPYSQGLDEGSLRKLSCHIGNEWEMLGTHLGLRRDQIERLKHDNANSESRVFNMLLIWRRMQPPDVDLSEVLAEALKNTGRRDLALTYHKIHSSLSAHEELGLSSTTVEHPVLPPGTTAFDIRACQRELKTYYEHRMGTVQMLPWGHDVVNMDDIFVNLTLVVDEKLPLGSTGKLLKTPEEVAFLEGRHGQRLNRVLVKGFAGSGKSTAMAKLAHDWARQNQNTKNQNTVAKSSRMSHYKLLFVLSLREVEAKNTLTDAIFDQILPQDTTVSRQGLEWYLQSHGKDVLVLLDGFDEFSMERLPKKVNVSMESILANQKMRETCVVVTTRPYKVQDLGDHQTQYAHIKLTGFSEDNIEAYIKKFFKGNKLSSKGLLDKIQMSPSIKTLAQIPVMLLMMCLLWGDMQQLPDTYTELYHEATLYIWRRYMNTYDIDRTDEDIDEVLLTLGKVALNGVISTGKLVFSEDEFPDQILMEACRTGLLTKERLRSKLNIRTSVSFLHKSVQEYCAAYFWVTLAEKGEDAFQLYLKHIDRDDQVFANIDVLSFCCGLSVKAAAFVLPHVVQVLEYRTNNSLRIGGITEMARKDIWPLFRMLYESKLEYDACVHSWLEPLFQSKVVEIRQNPASSLRYFHHLVSIAKISKMDSVLSQVRELKLFCWSECAGLIIETLDEMTHVESLVFSWETEVTETRPSQSERVALSSGLSEILNRLSQLKDITVLAKRTFDISNIIASFIHGPSDSIRKIELGNVEFDTDSMGCVLKRQTSLTSFFLTNVNITSQGASKMLSQLGHFVQNVHLVSSPIGSAVQYLKPIMPSLQELVLRDANLQENHVSVLADLLPKAGQLKHLDLSWNNVGTSMEKLASQLQHCPCMEILTLNHANISQSGVMAMIASLQFLPQLTNLTFSLGKQLSRFFKNHRNNGFEIVEAILRSFPHLPNLKWLHVKNLHAPKGSTASDMSVTCLSVIDFNWSGIFHQQAATPRLVVKFGLLFGPKEMTKVKVAVVQYIHRENEVD